MSDILDEPNSLMKKTEHDPNSRSVGIVWRYGFAVFLVVVAFAIRYAMSPVLGEELPFMLFIAAALIAAWYGGAASGIVALLLGLLLADYFFIWPRHPVA